MKSGNTLTQRIIVNQPQVITVDVPQTISFRKIKRKRGGETATQAHIQVLSPPVNEVLTYNEKNKKTQLISLWKISFKKIRQEKESRDSNVA